jgi:hypothetical protein
VALALSAGLLSGQETGGAEADLELRAAQQELKLARTYLQAASRRYRGHRTRALEHVAYALRAVRLGLLDAAWAREHGAAAHERPPLPPPAPRRSR